MKPVFFTAAGTRAASEVYRLCAFQMIDQGFVAVFALSAEWRAEGGTALDTARVLGWAWVESEDAEVMQWVKALVLDEDEAQVTCAEALDGFLGLEEADKFEERRAYWEAEAAAHRNREPADGEQGAP